MQTKNVGIMYQIINNIKIFVSSFHNVEYYPYCEIVLRLVCTNSVFFTTSQFSASFLLNKKQ